MTRKALISDPQSELDGAYVRRVLHDLFHAQHAKALVVVNHAAENCNQTVLTIDQLRRIGEPFFKSGCYRDDLERGSRLIGVADSAVDPRLRAVLGVFVGIECRIIAHTKDLARARVHHNDRDSFGMRLLGARCYLLLNNVLDVLIDRGDQVRTRSNGLFDTVEAAAPRVGHDKNSAGVSAYAVVVSIFETP